MTSFSSSPRSARSLRWLIVCALLSVVTSLGVAPAQLAFADPPPTSFADEFDSPTLDPAWEVVEFTGTRAYGYPPPANHVSLTANPGSLRYYLDPMTVHDGFINGFQTTTYGPNTYDPGVELRRTFSGEDWVIEAKVAYYMPFSNGRAETLRVYFGDGGAGTYFMSIERWRDGPWPPGTPETNPVLFRLGHKFGATVFDVAWLEEMYAPPSPGDVYYYRFERAGGVLTTKWSSDSTNWHTIFSHDLGTQLGGLPQHFIIAGHSWHAPAGSYADYDYVRLQPTNEPPDCSQAYPNTSTLWPPNHLFVPVVVMGVTDPDEDPVAITIDSIWQDEPVDTFGDGRFTPDGMGVGTATASVRAERSGTADGRVYHVSFTAADGQGGTCSGVVQVSMPHDQNRPAVDGGALYDSTLP